MKKNTMPREDALIVVSRLNKEYTIHHEKPTLVESLIAGPSEQFWALKQINFRVRKGEKIGILGPNGSGKTTLLKTISGIIAPTHGTISLRGSLVPIIDVDAGFHPDLTGEQNIYLNGIIIGMSRSEIKEKIARIIAFAGIGRFIDVPYYTYSQGMKLRLGLSIALHAHPDILIVDEAIVVADKEFQKKALQRIQELFRSGMTILMASHWLDYIKLHCTRIFILKNGKLVADGSVDLVEEYRAMKLPSLR